MARSVASAARECHLGKLSATKSSLAIAPFPAAILGALLFFRVGLLAGAASPDSSPLQLAEKSWSEFQSAHFRTFSYGPTQEVTKLVARLEQFRQAYSTMAGAQAVASPPIVVMAFAEHRDMVPFLPLYEGKPISLAAYFSRGSDENLIVLPLRGGGSQSLELVFHEYTHLLLRHNQHIWPLWLSEGMAEIYSTFQLSGGRLVHIGKASSAHLQILQHQSWLTLEQLFAVNHESPDYNERERQGIFYAESWLLTHYLMIGDRGSHRAALSSFSSLLRKGQTPEQAFTNACGVSLFQMGNQLRLYFARGKFETLDLLLNTDVGGAQNLAMRPMVPVEVLFRLGDILLRIGQVDAAETFFRQGQKVAPRSPFPYEGLGALAAEREKHSDAVKFLSEALQRGAPDFLAHYLYARERYAATSPSEDKFTRIDDPAVVAQIRAELKKALLLMPDFGPAHHLLGFFELVQGDDLAEAEQHLKRAIQLEPENQAYLLSLAQAQARKKDLAAARQTLESLQRPYVEPHLRAYAEEMLKALK